MVGYFSSVPENSLDHDPMQFFSLVFFYQIFVSVLRGGDRFRIWTSKRSFQVHYAIILDNRPDDS